MNSDERSRKLLQALDYHLPETRAEYDLDLAKASALLTEWERTVLAEFKKCVEDAHSAGEVMDWLQGREAELSRPAEKGKATP